MHRFKQQLPDEECVAILNEAYRGFLSVVGMIVEPLICCVEEHF